MKIPLINTSLKFSSRNLFYVGGYTFPSKYDVFSLHNSFPTYKLTEEGQSWQGMQCKKKLLTIA